MEVSTAADTARAEDKPVDVSYEGVSRHIPFLCLLPFDVSSTDHNNAYLLTFSLFVAFSRVYRLNEILSMCKG